jgi:predicted transcriptional regulator YdeE
MIVRFIIFDSRLAIPRMCGSISKEKSMIYYIQYYSNDGGGTTYRIGVFYSTPEKAENALQELIKLSSYWADMYEVDDIWVTKAHVQ